MANSVNANPVVIRRILCALVRAELITSQTGVAGGSRLVLKASQVTLLDVYRAVEGDASLPYIANHQVGVVSSERVVEGLTRETLPHRLKKFSRER
jgi:DNA-binding IscR family transcriptional regulator